MRAVVFFTTTAAIYTALGTGCARLPLLYLYTFTFTRLSLSSSVGR